MLEHLFYKKDNQQAHPDNEWASTTTKDIITFLKGEYKNENASLWF